MALSLGIANSYILDFFEVLRYIKIKPNTCPSGASAVVTRGDRKASHSTSDLKHTHNKALKTGPLRYLQPSNSLFTVLQASTQAWS